MNNDSIQDVKVCDMSTKNVDDSNHSYGQLFRETFC